MGKQFVSLITTIIAVS